jgi:hypothetical protein
MHIFAFRPLSGKQKRYKLSATSATSVRDLFLLSLY